MSSDWKFFVLTAASDLMIVPMIAVLTDMTLTRDRPMGEIVRRWTFAGVLYFILDAPAYALASRLGSYVALGDLTTFVLIGALCLRPAVSMCREGKKAAVFVFFMIMLASIVVFFLAGAAAAIITRLAGIEFGDMFFLIYMAVKVPFCVGFILAYRALMLATVKAALVISGEGIGRYAPISVMLIFIFWCFDAITSYTPETPLKFSAFYLTLGVTMGLAYWLICTGIVVRDVREKERNEALDMARANAALGRTDPLTGIANRRKFDEFFALEWERSMAEGTPLSLIMVDVDDFKKYNDTYGHPRGDECLKIVARAIAGAARRSSDLAARIGGEEFCLALPNTTLENAVNVAERMRKTVEDSEIPSAAGPSGAKVTISLGVAHIAPKPGDSLEKFIAAVDAFLYEAKNSGRNRVTAGEA
jgi:diguanylate cyclase (GGDEF)-like protein